MTVVMSAGEVRADVATGGRDELGRVEDLKIQADLTDLTCGLIEGDMLPGLSGTLRVPTPLYDDWAPSSG